MLPERGIERRRSHLSRRRRATVSAERGETRNQLQPAREDPNQWLIKLHRGTGKQEEQESGKKLHWLPPSPRSSRGGNGGNRLGVQRDNNTHRECLARLREGKRKPKEGAQGLRS